MAWQIAVKKVTLITNDAANWQLGYLEEGTDLTPTSFPAWVLLVCTWSCLPASWLRA